jgi:flavin-dependent thymidylate synthase
MKIELLGHYGGDETHALSAWTSTKRELTDEREGRMDKLLKMLAENGHHTPFEKSFLHFAVECDTASHIHLLKHRIGVSVNGESARYKELTVKSHVPEDWPPDLQEELKSHCNSAELGYKSALQRLEPLVGRKRAKESARYFLTYANCLLLDVSFNFRSFMHFQGLRNAEDAQNEIEAVAEQMLKLVRGTGDFEYSLRGFGW